jgi:hypothetical protein
MAGTACDTIFAAASSLPCWSDSASWIGSSIFDIHGAQVGNALDAHVAPAEDGLPNRR